ncbi:MAG: LLM class flavin-dependent oxidoreductase [Dehalococcoidia bacterium]|nr:LLM class flavin-dependent oxidoreductase [Dehalococcoidia bacterium]
MEFFTGGGALWKARGMPAALADGYEGYVAAARLAEELGFDGFGAPEHHFMYDSFIPLPLQALAAAAAVTSRVKLKTGAMLQPLYDPIEAAEYAAVLDVVSSGRAILGLGMGYRPYEFDGFGYDKKSRGERLAEAIRVIELATSNDTFSFEGKHYQYRDVSLSPRSVQRPIPIWYLGGTSIQAAQRAGREGFPYWLANSSFERTQRMVAEYRKAAFEAGWPEERMQIAAQKDICIGETLAEAEERRLQILDNFYDEHILGYGYLVDDRGRHVYGATREHPVYQQFVSSIYCGTLEMVVEELKRYEALGMTAVSIGGDPHFIAEKILPEFRRGPVAAAPAAQGVSQ